MSGVSAFDEMRDAAAALVKLVERYEHVINTGDASTRAVIPSGDKTVATSRLTEVTTLQAARAYCHVRHARNRGKYASADEYDKAVEADARVVAASTEFRAAIDAAVRMILVRQR